MHPRHARRALSRLRCNGHSLLLSSYLSRIGRIENPFCSACGPSFQDTSHLILHCPATDSLRHLLFSDSLSLYGLWSRPWGVARLLGLHGLRPCPIPRKGSGNNNNDCTDRNRRIVTSSSQFEASKKRGACLEGLDCFKNLLLLCQFSFHCFEFVFIKSILLISLQKSC